MTIAEICKRLLEIGRLKSQAAASGIPIAFRTAVLVGKREMEELAALDAEADTLIAEVNEEIEAERAASIAAEDKVHRQREHYDRELSTFRERAERAERQLAEIKQAARTIRDAADKAWGKWIGLDGHNHPEGVELYEAMETVHRALLATPPAEGAADCEFCGERKDKHIPALLCPENSYTSSLHALQREHHYTPPAKGAMLPAAAHIVAHCEAVTGPVHPELDAAVDRLVTAAADDLLSNRKPITKRLESAPPVATAPPAQDHDHDYTGPDDDGGAS